MSVQGVPGKLFVRRRLAELPKDLQEDSPGCSTVDWHQSLLLNLVMQTTWELSTAALRQGLCFQGLSWLMIALPMLLAVHMLL